jgi:trehalose/maltose hydrolase-like predicted phosphorylase
VAQVQNPLSARWVPDHSSLQRHVGAAIPYDVWQYFQVTHDREFLEFYGAELILEIARFWSSLRDSTPSASAMRSTAWSGLTSFTRVYRDARFRAWPTAEGIHLGAMAGTVDLVQRVSTGIEATGDVLRFNPRLPDEIVRLDMPVSYRGHSLDIRLTRETLTIRGRDRGPARSTSRCRRPSVS